MIIIGVDEVGLGPVAGPLATAAVAFPKGFIVPGITDSKALSDYRRRVLAPLIQDEALHWVIARSSHAQIDKYGQRPCKLACMAACVRRCLLHFHTTHVIVDGIDPIPGINCETMVKADLKIAAVSAASIIAKVYRDDLMVAADARYPGYGFDRNMGYPTKAHVAALEERGPCQIHRRSTAPVKRVLRKELG